MSDTTSLTLDYQSSSFDSAIPLRIRNSAMLQNPSTTDSSTQLAIVRQATPPPPIDISSLPRTTLLKTYQLNSSDRKQPCRICAKDAQQLLHFTISYLHPTTPLTDDSCVPVCNSPACGEGARLILANREGELMERSERGEVKCGNCGAKSRSALCGACKFSRGF